MKTWLWHGHADVASQMTSIMRGTQSLSGIEIMAQILVGMDSVDNLVDVIDNAGSSLDPLAIHNVSHSVMIGV